MITIPYTALLDKNGKKIDTAPFARVQLNYKKTHKVTAPISALIDSGSSVCFCREMIGAWLGIQLDKIKEEEFKGINRSSFHAKPAMVNLIAYGKTYECKFFFTEDLPPHAPIILGQRGFFDHFKITFDRSNNQIILD